MKEFWAGGLIRNFSGWVFLEGRKIPICDLWIDLVDNSGFYPQKSVYEVFKIFQKKKIKIKLRFPSRRPENSKNNILKIFLTSDCKFRFWSESCFSWIWIDKNFSKLRFFGFSVFSFRGEGSFQRSSVSALFFSFWLFSILMT